MNVRGMKPTRKNLGFISKEFLFPILFFLTSFSLHPFNVRTLTMESSRPERAAPSLAAECQENHQKPVRAA
jgi:hypothetical protein